MVTKRFEFPVRVLKAYQDSFGDRHVVAIASDNGIDWYNERMDLSALEDMINDVKKRKANKPDEGMVDLLETHWSTFGIGYGWDGWINRNVETGFYEFVVDLKLKTNYAMASELYDDVKNGTCDKQLSVGGYITGEEDYDWEEVVFEDTEGNKITEMIGVIKGFSLDHIACTREGWAANPRTGFLSAIAKSVRDKAYQTQAAEWAAKRAVPFKETPVSSAESWDGDSAKTSLKNWASSDGSGDKDTIDWAKYRRGFAWYEESDAENFGAYKLPHHVVEDGTLKLHKGGLSAAMAALNGARGGTDIPDSERQSVYNHLKKHYAQVDEEAPELKSIHTINWLEKVYMDIGKLVMRVFKEREVRYMESLERCKSLVGELSELLGELKDEDRQEIVKSLFPASTEEAPEAEVPAPEAEPVETPPAPVLDVEKSIADALAGFREELDARFKQIADLVDQKTNEVVERIPDVADITAKVAGLEPVTQRVEEIAQSLKSIDGRVESIEALAPRAKSVSDQVSKSGVDSVDQPDNRQVW